MMYRKWNGLLIGLIVLALALAACGGDDGDRDDAPAASTAEAGEAQGTGFNPQAGPDLALSSPGSASGLPGCSDPDDDACPMPLDLALTDEVSAEDITLTYPGRYFEPGAADDALIVLVPTENNRFAERATFRIYFADSIEAVTAPLTEPFNADWETDNLGAGVIAVEKDQEQDPPVNTTIGAFQIADGRVLVFELVATGKYGWDLFSRAYEQMLNSIVIGDSAAATAEATAEAAG